MRPTKEEREKYCVDYSSDTDFSAFARLLQSKWRDKKGFPVGKLGNYLDIEFAKRTKNNFLTSNIQQLVTEQIVHARQNGGLIGEPRIWNNLLSSQPLCFNLFGELHFNKDLATSFFSALFPERIEEVTKVTFEYSPGRGNPKYLGDYSAFDVFVEYQFKNRKGFVGIEVKYAECLREESKGKADKQFRSRYATVSNECNLFKSSSFEILKQPPLSQIWRDHLLAISLRQDYDDGFFVFLFPSKNSQCQNGIDAYKTHLFSEDEKVTNFCPRHLDDFIRTLRQLNDCDWTQELEERYLGLNN